MAIISIPSSIGGVTVPGLATNGPLGILFNNPFATLNLQYPRDLQSTARGHYVTFLVKDIVPVGYEGQPLTSIGGLGTLAKNFFAAVGSAAADAEGYSPANETNSQTSVDLTLTKKTYVDRASISLYIPETMNFQYNNQYNSVSLTEIEGKAVGAILGSITSKIPGAKGIIGKAIGSGIEAAGSAANIGLQKGLGVAVNPQLQLLYEGLNFREYQLAFTFTPYSQQEAQAVTNIIKAFKEYAAPRIVPGAGGMLFIPPAVFQPKFYFDGQLNPNVNQVTESVLTSIDVNYGQNGWSTFNDGTPTQTTLTMQFQETQLLDRKTLMDGNY